MIQCDINPKGYPTEDVVLTKKQKVEIMTLREGDQSLTVLWIQRVCAGQPHTHTLPFLDNKNNLNICSDVGSRGIHSPIAIGVVG